MTRKKRKTKSYLPCFVFTPETLHITQEAVKLLKQALQQADHQDVKVQFAAETIDQVKGKLEVMSRSLGLRCLVTFDYNEKLMLGAAIQLYIANLLFSPLNAKLARVLHQCRQIAAYFAVDHTK
jgi:hypothetical protein